MLDGDITQRIYDWEGVERGENKRGEEKKTMRDKRRETRKEGVETEEKEIKRGDGMIAKE